MPTSYEPDILEEFADRLYKQAGEITSQYIFGGIFGGIFFGALVGLGLGFAQSVLQNSKASPGDITATSVPLGVAGALIVVVLGGISGFYSAREKVFELKFKAQQTLCQLQIEKNTRRADTVTRGLEPVTN